VKSVSKRTLAELTKPQTGLTGFEPVNAAVKALCLNRLAIAHQPRRTIKTGEVVILS
jgi:hypothetical protein